MESKKNRTVKLRNERSFIRTSIKAVYSVMGQIGVKEVEKDVKKESRLEDISW